MSSQKKRNPDHGGDQDLECCDYFKAKRDFRIAVDSLNCKKSYQTLLEEFIHQFSDFERDFWEGVLLDEEREGVRHV